MNQIDPPPRATLVEKEIDQQIVTCELAYSATGPTVRADNWYVCCNNNFLVVDDFRYFFPTYENDALLCSLEDDEDEDEKEGENSSKESNQNSTDRS